jgi:hypothetical protein
MDHTGFCPHAELQCGNVFPAALTAARHRAEAAAIRLHAAFSYLARHRAQILGTAIGVAIVAAIIATTVWVMSVDTSSASMIADGPMPTSSNLWQSIPAAPAASNLPELAGR